MPLFDDPDEEIRQIERVQATPKSQPDQQTKVLTKAWAEKAPWMKPKAALLLAQKGIDPSSSEGQQIARAGVKTKSKGLGWHSIGDVVKGGLDAVSNVADFVTPEAVENEVGRETADLSRIVKPVVRGTMTALQTGGELVSATAREVASGRWSQGTSGIVNQKVKPGANVLQQTTVGQAFEEYRKTGHIDLGSGYFPAGEASKQQAEVARKALSINGHAATIGRIAAQAVAEPGSRPYNIVSGLLDAGAAWYGDPANAALKGIGHANTERKLFDAGAVDGITKGVLADRVDGWLNSKPGRSVVDFLTNESDYNTIRARTGAKLGAKLELGLADARTEQEVLDLLRPELGVSLLEKPTLTRLPEIRARMDRVRLLQDMPGTHIDPNNIDDAVREIDLFQKNAKLAPDLIAKNNRLMAEANTPADVYDVVINSVLRDSMQSTLGKKITKAWSNSHNEFAKYFVDEIGENAYVPGALIDGTGKALPTPHLYVEYLNGSIPLPDARAIRRATSTLGRMVDAHPTLDLGVAAGDWFMGSIWKPMVLLRGAWTVRVVGEEQARMGVAGLSSMFAHPLSNIADLIGKRGATGIAGDVLRDSEEGIAALSKGSGGFRGGDLLRTKYKTVYAIGDEHFSRSWADELAQLHADPIAKRLVTGLGEGEGVPGGKTGNALVDVKNWFSSGAGQKYRNELASRSGRQDLTTRVGADAYIDSVLKRIQIKTGDDQRLLDLVGNGAFDGEKFADAGKTNAKLNSILDEIAAEGVGPQKVKGDLLVATRRGAGGKVSDAADRATEFLFNALMSKPTNYLSRSPAFRQFYWRRAETLMESLDEAGQVEALANARKSGLAGDVIKRLESAAARGTGTLKLADADLIAKGYGLDQTRELLYDLHRRSQFFDVNRLVAPFGEAWKELTGTYAKLGTEHPNLVRRVQQIITGGKGSGFFYTDESSDRKDLIFNYPGSAWVNEKLFGAPIPFTGRVQGLSVMTEILPGVGPVVQIPAAALLPETPSWDGVRQILLPFGEADPETGFLESQLPAWLQKVRTSGFLSGVPGLKPSPDQARLLNNTAFDLLAYEVSAGKRPRPSSLEEIKDAVDDNMEKAKWLYIVRAAAQQVSPTAPSPQQVAADKSGNVLIAQRMRDDLYDMQEKQGYDAGFKAWMDRYGDAAFLVIQPKSQSLVYGAPVTSDGVRWERANPGVVKSFPDVYGFFAPTSGEFDYAAYARQFRTGKRSALSPEQAVMLANSRLATAIYDEQRKRLPPSPTADQRAWLRQVKDSLIEEYPGFTDTPGLASKATRDTAIRQLEKAAADPRLSSTDAGQGLAKYLKARKMAQGAGTTPTSFRASRSLAPVRDWLRTVSDAVRREHPAFTPIWDQVFDRELTDDNEEG